MSLQRPGSTTIRRFSKEVVALLIVHLIVKAKVKKQKKQKKKQKRSKRKRRKRKKRMKRKKWRMKRKKKKRKKRRKRRKRKKQKKKRRKRRMMDVTMMVMRLVADPSAGLPVAARSKHPNTVVWIWD